MHFKTDWKTYKRMYFKICFRIESRRDKAASVWPQGARRFGFQTKTPSLAAFSRRREARLRPRRPLSLPYGLGGSAPSPYAPPRQAGRPGPIGHSVVGFCGTAWGE